MFYLLRHLHVLRCELESKFNRLEDIKYAGTPLANLPYLRATVDESVRLTQSTRRRSSFSEGPPAWHYYRRHLLPTRCRGWRSHRSITQTTALTLSPSNRNGG